VRQRVFERWWAQFPTFEDRAAMLVEDLLREPAATFEVDEPAVAHDGWRRPGVEIGRNACGRSVTMPIGLFPHAATPLSICNPTRRSDLCRLTLVACVIRLRSEQQVRSVSTDRSTIR
jgi:hypothetical protein